MIIANVYREMYYIPQLQLLFDTCYNKHQLCQYTPKKAYYILMLEIKSKFNKPQYSTLAQQRIAVEQNNMQLQLYTRQVLQDCKAAILASLKEREPQSTVFCVKFIKDLIETLNKDFIAWVADQILPIYSDIGKFDHNSQDASRGKFFFSKDPSKELMQYGQTLLILILESIQVWALWFEGKYLQTFNQLKSMNVLFPQRTYFKEDQIKKIKDKLSNPLLEKAKVAIQQYQRLDNTVREVIKSGEANQLIDIELQYQGLINQNLFNQLTECEDEEAMDLAEKLIYHEENATQFIKNYQAYLGGEISMKQFQAHYINQTPGEERYSQVLQEVSDPQLFKQEAKQIQQPIKSEFAQAQFQPSQNISNKQPQQQEVLKSQPPQLFKSEVKQVDEVLDLRIRDQDQKNKIAELQYKISLMEVAEQEYKTEHQKINHQLKVELQEAYDQITQLHRQLESKVDSDIVKQQQIKIQQLEAQQGQQQYSQIKSNFHDGVAQLEQKNSELANEIKQQQQIINGMQNQGDLKELTIQLEHRNTELANQLKFCQQSNQNHIEQIDDLKHRIQELEGSLTSNKQELLRHVNSHLTANDYQKKIQELEHDLSKTKQDLFDAQNMQYRQQQEQANQIYEVQIQQEAKITMLSNELQAKNELLKKFESEKGTHLTTLEQKIIELSQTNMKMQQELQIQMDEKIALHQGPLKDQQIQYNQLLKQYQQQNNELQQLKKNKYSIDLFKFTEQPQQEQQQEPPNQIIQNLIFPLTPEEFYQFKEKKYSQFKGNQLNLSYTIQRMDENYKNSILSNQSLLYSHEILDVFQIRKQISYLLYFKLKLKQSYLVKQFTLAGQKCNLDGLIQGSVLSQSFIMECSILNQEFKDIVMDINLEDAERGYQMHIAIPNQYLLSLEPIPKNDLRQLWKSLQLIYKSTFFNLRIPGHKLSTKYPQFQLMISLQKYQDYKAGICDLKVGCLFDHIYLIRLIVKPHSNKALIQLKTNSRQEDRCQIIITDLIFALQ